MRLRQVFIEWPAKAVDVFWMGYVVLVFALSLVAIAGVVVMLIAYAVGIRLFW